MAKTSRRRLKATSRRRLKARMPDRSGDATGDMIVDLAARHIGQSYKLGQSVPKDDPKWSGPWDCAEFCSWLVYQVSRQLYGCAPGSNSPATANAYTGYWRDDAKSRGKIVTIEEACRTPGAFILRVPITTGHIVVSDGKGGTIEAMGAAYGVRRAPVTGRAWDFGILVPSISYTKGPTKPGQSENQPPSQKIIVLRRHFRTAEDPRVEMLQRALSAAGFDPGPFDGLFGPLTERAVFEFQSAKGLFVDGEVGPETGRALKLKFWKASDTVPAFNKPANPQEIIPAQADWPNETRVVNPSIVFNDIRSEYINLWNTMAIRPEHRDEIAAIARKIIFGRDRYSKVATAFAGLPWHVVGILHAMECSCNFAQHLHNGDPLVARTVHAPKNRPSVWDPSWNWEFSAHDAILVDGLDKIADWTLSRTLFVFEQYNGMGPRRRFGRATAYLWSCSNHYVRGKYVGDGIWDPEATSKQVGAAVLLHELVSGHAISQLEME